MNRSLAIRLVLAAVFFAGTCWIEAYVVEMLNQIKPFHWAMLPVWMTWFLTGIAGSLLIVFWKPIE